MQQVFSLSVLQDGHCLFVETHTELILCMFTRLCTKFSMPSLLVVLSDRKKKNALHRICEVTMLGAPFCFYAVQKGFLLRNLRIFPISATNFRLLH